MSMAMSTTTTELQTKGLRQRSPLSNSSIEEQHLMSSRSNHEKSAAFRSDRGTQIQASTLLQSSPTHHGKVYKLHIPIIYALAYPLWLKRCLHFMARCSPRFIASTLCPSWKERHLILIGKYLYRFQSNNNNNNNNNVNSNVNSTELASASKLKHKGCPLPIKTMQSQTLSHMYHDANLQIQFHEMSAHMTHLPSFCDGYFSITSPTTNNNKTHYYAVSTREEAQVWVSSIVSRRQEVITQEMGHSQVPYRKSWEGIDSSGRRIWESKQRIQKRLDRQGRREMELVVMGMGDGIGGAGAGAGAGGPMPSGYYG